MAQNIVVEISAVGNVKIEAVGYEGTACSTDTRELELVLGGGAANKKTDYKPEFSMPNSTSQNIKSTF